MRLFIPSALALAALALAQQDDSQSKPLFGKKLDYKSSKSSKESTTLGFNGIDPSGKVDAKMLATTPTGDDQKKVKQMSENQPKPADLQSFLKEGGLKAK